MKKDLVIKIGGSLLYQDDMRLNDLFLEKLKKWFIQNKDSFRKLAIVVGGGKLSREVGKSAKGYIEQDDIHAVSMQVTQVNAQLVSGYLNDDRNKSPQSLNEAYEILNSNSDEILVSGGLKNGWSTDMDAAVFADCLSLKTVYKLSNVEGVYTADPKKDSKAQFIKEISWKEYIEMFDITEDSSHVPNKSTPISSETAIFCKNKGITYYVSGGKNIYEKDDLSFVFESGTKLF